MKSWRLALRYHTVQVFQRDKGVPRLGGCFWDMAWLLITNHLKLPLCSPPAAASAYDCSLGRLFYSSFFHLFIFISIPLFLQALIQEENST